MLKLRIYKYRNIQKIKKEGIGQRNPPICGRCKCEACPNQKITCLINLPPGKQCSCSGNYIYIFINIIFYIADTLHQDACMHTRCFPEDHLSMGTPGDDSSFASCALSNRTAIKFAHVALPILHVLCNGGATTSMGSSLIARALHLFKPMSPLQVQWIITFDSVWYMWHMVVSQSRFLAESYGRLWTLDHKANHPLRLGVPDSYARDEWPRNMSI